MGSLRRERANDGSQCGASGAEVSWLVGSGQERSSEWGEWGKGELVRGR